MAVKRTLGEVETKCDVMKTAATNNATIETSISPSGLG